MHATHVFTDDKMGQTVVTVSLENGNAPFTAKIVTSEKIEILSEVDINKLYGQLHSRFGIHAMKAIRKFLVAMTGDVKSLAITRRNVFEFVKANKPRADKKKVTKPVAKTSSKK